MMKINTLFAQNIYSKNHFLENITFFMKLMTLSIIYSIRYCIYIYMYAKYIENTIVSEVHYLVQDRDLSSSRFLTNT